MTETVADLVQNASNIGLRINGKRAEVMKVSREDPNDIPLQVAIWKFAKVENFKYHRTWYNRPNNLKQEINQHIFNGFRTYFSLKQIIS